MSQTVRYFETQVTMSFDHERGTPPTREIGVTHVTSPGNVTAVDMISLARKKYLSVGTAS